MWNVTHPTPLNPSNSSSRAGKGIAGLSTLYHEDGGRLPDPPRERGSLRAEMVARWEQPATGLEAGSVPGFIPLLDPRSEDVD